MILIKRLGWNMRFNLFTLNPVIPCPKQKGEIKMKLFMRVFAEGAKEPTYGPSPGGGVFTNGGSGIRGGNRSGSGGARGGRRSY